MSQESLEETPEDFDSWTSLIAQIEKTSPNDLQKICLVYDAFLSEFPLCYGYWNKYAMHKARLCALSEVEEIYERAIEVMPFSVDLWVNYCTFGVLTYEDPADIRRLFERGLSLVKKDYRCYLLWDKYIEFEYFQKNWSHLAHIYVRTLQFPTRKLTNYYDRFKSLINKWIEDVGCQDESNELTDVMDSYGQRKADEYGYADISKLISDFLDKKDGLPVSTAFKKYSFIGEQFYHSASKIDRDISLFEGRIKRYYFHVKPLDDSQLETWHQYLDFVENQGDFDWAVKLYERCLIPCASYSDFWIRYIEFVDSKGGREIANHALNRADTLFLKKNPSFHLYCAMYKEYIGDVSGSRAIFLQRGQDLTSEFIENVNREANMEKRMGNIGAAHLVYEKAIDLAKEKNVQILPILYTNFARFMFVATGKTDAARDRFIKGIQEVPSRSILQALVQFMIVHGGAGDITKLEFIISNAIDTESEISQALSTEDRKCISKSYLEFLDLYGDIHDIRRAWGHHRKLFPYGSRPAFSDTNKSIGDTNNTCQLNSKIVCLGSLSGSPDKHVLECVARKDNANILSEGDMGSLPQEKKENEETILMDTIDAKVHDESMMERDELHVAINEPNDYSTDMAHLPVLTESEILRESCDAVSPPSIDKLTISCRDNEDQQMKSAVLDSNHPQQVTVISCSGNMLDEVKVSSPTSCSEKVQDVKAGDTKNDKLESVDITSNSIAEADLLEKKTHFLPVAGPAAEDAQINPICQMEVKLQHDLPVITANPQTGNSIGQLDQMNYKRQMSESSTSRSPTDTHASKVQQWQAQAHAQYASTGYNPEIVGQAYPYQPQVWTNQHPPQVNQNQGFQAYQNGFPAWSGQSTQMHASPCANSQPSTQIAQPSDFYQQYGYFQNNQGVSPHMWHYYQQQQQHYYLQHQPQNQQTNKITEHQPQKHPQQKPAEVHQSLLQPEQQHQNQQNDSQIELQQNAPSSEKIPNQKHQHQQHSSQSQQQGMQQYAQEQHQQLLYVQQQQYLQHHQQQHFHQQLYHQHHHNYQQQQQQQEQHPPQKQEWRSQQQVRQLEQRPEGRYRQEKKQSQHQLQQQKQPYEHQQQHAIQVNPHQQEHISESTTTTKSYPTRWGRLEHISESEVQISNSEVPFQNKEDKLHDVEQSACSRSSTPQVSQKQ